jgi:hypothetical protein
MSERDWRTKLKALYLLHTILRYTPPEDGVIFRALLEKMSREQCAKTGGLYFSAQRIPADVEGNIFNNFMSHYAGYVLKVSHEQCA